MHEVSIANNILKVAFQAADSQQASKINKIVIKIGAFSGVMTDSLLFGLEALTQNTIASSAKIEIIAVPLVILCKKCQKEFEIIPQAFLCPHCKNTEIRVVSGEDIELVSLEVDR